MWLQCLGLLHMSKTKGGNLSTMTIALTSFVSCEVLGLATPFVGSCWGHAISKFCQHATNDYKVCSGLTTMSIKETQSILQKTITWTKKSRKK
jgi:hypothetical protein